MTPLRKQMIRAMELKNLSATSQRAYLAAVTGLTRRHRTYQALSAISRPDYRHDDRGLSAVSKPYIVLQSQGVPGTAFIFYHDQTLPVYLIMDISVFTRYPHYPSLFHHPIH